MGPTWGQHGVDSAKVDPMVAREPCYLVNISEPEELNKRL